VEPIWGWDEEWQANYFRQKFDPGRQRIIVCDGHDAGVLVVEERPDEIYVGLIELLPAYQRRGIGAAILNQLAADAHRRGLPLALHVLTSNDPARRLYERLGFMVVAEEEYRRRMVSRPER
jgi:ribosomal protein S18 acetylase RimI-like enzyme